MHAVFDESCIFRIDHFLGKECIDNILAFRFANGMFEPIWNRDHVSYVQIDVPETLSIEGRADFYDKTGAYRDMIVTHLLQVLGFVAMEPPTSLGAKSLRDEKSKVFDSMRMIDPAKVVRGQYKGYRDEPGVAKRSQTETFVAVEVAVDNWRWHGVPFYLRTGKSLAQSRQVITLGFRGPALKMFPIDLVETHGSRRNELVIDFKDPGSISASFLTKEPGPVHAARRGVDAVPLHRLVGRVEQPRGIRTADPQCDARRPSAVHPLGRHRATVGDLDAAARGPAAGRGVRTGIMGATSRSRS